MTVGLRRSAAAYERASAVIPGGVSSGVRRAIRPHPVFFSSGAGSRLIDVDGNEYTDYVLGWGQAILGHADPRLTAAVSAQLPRGTALGCGSELEVVVADRVLGRIPGMERLLWTNTGSEATQLALRLARAATGKQRYLKFQGHYHGWSDAFLIGYQRTTDHAGAVGGVESSGQARSSLADVDVVPFGDLAAVESALRSPSGDIAALFVDVLMCNGGLVAPPRGFLEGLRQVCTEVGAVLVFDEVITGFRIDPGGAVGRFGVVPDLVVLAKAISGGFPISAVAGRADVVEQAARGVFYSGTYNGNQVSLAAAGACLDALAEPGTYDDFERRGALLAAGIRSVLDREDIDARVSQFGPILHCSVDSQDLENAAGAPDDLYLRIVERLLDEGVFAAPDGRWYISTAHTDDDIERTVAAFESATRSAVTAARV